MEEKKFFTLLKVIYFQYKIQLMKYRNSTKSINFSPKKSTYRVGNKMLSPKQITQGLSIALAQRKQVIHK